MVVTTQMIESPMRTPSSSSFGKARSVIIDDLPLSFLPSTASKDDKIVLFGEIEISDEYNPMQPNDFEKINLEMEAEAARRKAENIGKDSRNSRSTREGSSDERLVVTV